MQIRWLGLVVVGALLFGACGDDTSAPADAGNDAGNAGKGGGGGGGSGGAGGALAVEITCGKLKCTAPELDVASLLGDAGGAFAAFLTPDALAGFGAAPEVCCSGKAEDACGVSNMALTGGMCIEQDQEGKPDAACPGIMNTMSVMGIPLTLNFNGCCRPDNKCGVEIGLLGVGCVERVAASGLAMTTAANTMLDAGGIDAGAPLEAIDCVYTPSLDDGGTDAGN